MPLQQLFYNSVIPVSAQRHANLAVKTGTDYAFARVTNAIPMNAVEFGPASAEYPIVFAGADDKVFPAVIVGVREGQNLQVAEDGTWRGRHIPEFVRRYPFIFSADASGERFNLHIDEEFDGANTDGRGERLFDADGEQTKYLQGVLKFLQNYQSHFARTQAFCQSLVEHELLQPMQAQFAIGGGQKRSLSGFQAVDRERLKALPDDVLGTLLRKDELECIYLHLASLRHFRELAELGAESEANAAPETPPAPQENDDQIAETVPEGTPIN